MSHLQGGLVAVITLLAVVGCAGGGNVDAGPTAAPAAMKLTVTSDAFAEGQDIPVRYTCDGDEVSPPLKWADVPTGTKSIAIIVDDPDTSNTFVHWVAFNFPATMTELGEGASGKMPSAVVEGKNGGGSAGYRGLCPPGGPHRYFFKVYALDIIPDLGSNARKQDLESKMAGHILAQGQMMGRYQRR